MDRGNHYERAFAAYVRWRGLLPLGIDEVRRGRLGDVSVKSPDFLVVGASGVRLAIDVKGRHFPLGPPGRRRHVWECWSTGEDVASLECWVGLLGDGYLGLFAFVYEILPEVELPAETEDCWEHQGRRYLFRAVAVDDYRRHLRVRSPRWGTVTLTRQDYRRVVHPLSTFLGDPDELNALERECWMVS